MIRVFVVRKYILFIDKPVHLAILQFLCCSRLDKRFFSFKSLSGLNATQGTYFSYRRHGCAPSVTSMCKIDKSESVDSNALDASRKVSVSNALFSRIFDYNSD